MVRRSRRYPHRDLSGLIQRSLADCAEFGPGVEVDGKPQRVPDGLWHDNYRFHVRGAGLPSPITEQAYFLRLLDQREEWQAGPEPTERLRREAETLQVLRRVEFAYPTPAFVCFVRNEGSDPIGMIETGLGGCPLDQHKGLSPLRTISRVAAEVHRLDVGTFPHLTGSRSRAEHVTSTLAELDDGLFAEFPAAEEVRQWIAAHAPAEDRGCVLHGDLLPQNLLGSWPIDDEPVELFGVVDWEMAQLGDPAYDLAIVTRGNRKVAGVHDGVKILVKEYLEVGGQPISLTDVRVHELLLILRWLEESWRDSQKPVATGHRPEHYIGQLQSVFRRSAP